MPNSVSQIPENEFRITFARSSGAGGQNVNKTSTKAIIHWPVNRSRVYSSEEKIRIRTKLANKINFFGELVVAAEEERSQPQNRAIAISRLRQLVSGALHIPKKRRPTKPTRASKIRRVESKKLRSRIKSTRRNLE